MVILKVAVPFLYVLTAHVLQFLEISWMGQCWALFFSA